MSASVELNDRTEVLKELYSYALNEAGIERELDWIEGGDLPGIYGRKVSFAKGALFVFVSEYAHDAVLCVRDRKTNRAYRFTLEKERSVLFAVDEAGKVISVYRAHEVDIQS